MSETSRGVIPGLLNPHPLAEMLPALMQDDDVSVRWVSGLDEVMAPIYSTLDNLEAYLEPRTTPVDWLPWLGQWVGLTAEPDSDVEHQRRLIVATSEFFGRRGTAAGLREFVAATLPCEIDVADSGSATWSATPGADLPGQAQAWVRVTVVSVEEGAVVSPANLRALIAAHVPAHVRLDLELGPLAEGTS